MDGSTSYRVNDLHTEAAQLIYSESLKKGIAYLPVHLKTLPRNSVKGRNKAQIGSPETLYFFPKISFLNRN